MSDSPLLGKMDALLKKHRGGDALPASEASAAPPPDAWLPVLTDVIERGTPPAPAEAPPATANAVEPVPTMMAPEPTPPAVAQGPLLPVGDTLTEQLMSELAPRLTEVMEKQVAAELRKNLDETVSTLLAQLDVNVREIVREAVAEKLKTPRDPSA
ncbi:MAG: hypothetical protein BGP21_06280 [Thiobacillus sp. 65-29]|jgi:hypothetical protein|nr:MAG: hypothetical protein BGP21_06280 [Thiobacillus sp. 65-29]